MHGIFCGNIDDLRLRFGTGKHQHFRKEVRQSRSSEVWGEERRRRKGEQLLIRGITKVSDERALHHALEDAKASFPPLASKPLSESQLPQVVRLRLEAITPGPKVILP